jgi:DNA-binding beta-propeller fold protein YncE
MKPPSSGHHRAASVAILAIGLLALAMAVGRSAPALAALTGEGTPPAQLTAGSAEAHPYEYVFQSGQIYIYDIDDEQKLVRHISGIPDTDGVRGMVVDPASHILYISHGGDGPEGSSHGSLLAYDLVSESVLWDREYSFPVDSGAITPDGTEIYMPTGENSSSGIWNILRSSDGSPLGSIKGPINAHNTIVSLNGKYVFLGGRNSRYLAVASAASNEIVKEIGPLNYGVRPFTVNGSSTLAFTTATSFLGFQVSSIATGQVLYTVPIPGFSLPPEYVGPPSHGISLTPDEKQLYVMDAPHDYVHVFDVSGLPSSAPRLIANIALSPRVGEEAPCPYDCGKSGWLQASRDGRYVFVGDTGDVIDTQTLKIVNTLAPLTETRQLLEIDWRDGVSFATTTRYGLGYVTGEGTSGSLTSPAPGPPLASESSPGPAPSLGASGLPIHGGPLPEITVLGIAPTSFRSKNTSRSISSDRATTAATVRYTDSAAALSTFSVLERVARVEGPSHRCVNPTRGARRRARGCWRYASIGRFSRRDLAGRNSFGFTGWVGGRRLGPGHYHLQAVASLGADIGAPRTVAFRVVR